MVSRLGGMIELMKYRYRSLMERLSINILGPGTNIGVFWSVSRISSPYSNVFFVEDILSFCVYVSFGTEG